MIFLLDENDITFPCPELAEEDGLLAVGGDLSAARLLTAYRKGIFPWYSNETPILWYSPHQRFVLYPDKIQISKSLRRLIQSGKFSITRDKAFSKVIEECASAYRKGQDETWITAEMKQAYIRLFELGHAHSVEVWDNNILAGGLYGVVVNNVFCGESMFSRESNASKCALAWLCLYGGYQLIDCQIYSEHLTRMGAAMISRQEYMNILNPRN